MPNMIRLNDYFKNSATESVYSSGYLKNPEMCSQPKVLMTCFPLPASLSFHDFGSATYPSNTTLETGISATRRYSFTIIVPIDIPSRAGDLPVFWQTCPATASRIIFCAFVVHIIDINKWMARRIFYLCRTLWRGL